MAGQLTAKNAPAYLTRINMNEHTLKESENLRSQHARIEYAIEKILQTDAEVKKAKQLDAHYEKIVCLICFGTGQVITGGADIVSDPPDEVPCENCHEPNSKIGYGRGWIYARIWDMNLARYDMNLDQRT